MKKQFTNKKITRKKNYKLFRSEEERKINRTNKRTILEIIKNRSSASIMQTFFCEHYYAHARDK